MVALADDEGIVRLDLREPEPARRVHLLRLAHRRGLVPRAARDRARVGHRANGGELRQRSGDALKRACWCAAALALAACAHTAGESTFFGPTNEVELVDGLPAFESAL